MSSSDTLHRVAIEDRGSYLSVTFPAYRDVESFLDYINKGFEAAKAHPSHRVLVDHTATRNLVPIADIYDLGQALSANDGVLQLRIALVSSSESVYPDRFFETVAANRGIGIRVFIEDFDAATHWLLK